MKKVLLRALVETGQQMEEIKFLECLRDSYHLLSDCSMQLNCSTLAHPQTFALIFAPLNMFEHYTK
jgi:hypothetical protein